jgi:hypothetical protein
MKNIFKFLGIITLMVVIGFSMVSCDDEPEEEDPEVGTIEVTNDSTMQHDVTTAGVTVILYKGDKEIKLISGIQSTTVSTSTKTKAVFSDIDVGDGYYVKVKDASNTTYPTAQADVLTFSLAKDQVKKLSYNGTKVIAK